MSRVRRERRCRDWWCWWCGRRRREHRILSGKKGSGRTIFIGIRKGGHVFGEDLGDTADTGGDDVEACTGGLKDGDAKGLGEGCVEEDGVADEDLVVHRGCEMAMGLGIEGTHVSHVPVSNGTE